MRKILLLFLFCLVTFGCHNKNVITSKAMECGRQFTIVLPKDTLNPSHQISSFLLEEGFIMDGNIFVRESNNICGEKKLAMIFVEDWMEYKGKIKYNIYTQLTFSGCQDGFKESYLYFDFLFKRMIKQMVKKY